MRLRAERNGITVVLMVFFFFYPSHVHKIGLYQVTVKKRLEGWLSG